MKLGNVARVVAVSAACFAAVGSATSTSSSQQQQPQQPQAGQNSPPPAQQMEPGLALGLWRSTFGAVKIEADDSRGGLQTGNVQGVWVYQRQGQEVVGYFSGNLRGNVMQFRWQEPSTPAPLTGEGYIVFDPTGRQYSGRWWSDRRDRVGDWNGWRQDGAQAGTPTDATYNGQGGPDPQQPQQQPARGFAPPPRQPPPTAQPAPPASTTYY
jgi:hypothetical protein